MGLNNTSSPESIKRNAFTVKKVSRNAGLFFQSSQSSDGSWVYVVFQASTSNLDLSFMALVVNYCNCGFEVVPDSSGATKPRCKKENLILG
jgi:hypothetical protein